LNVGLLREGDPADFIVVDDLARFNVEKTYINGVEVAANGRSLLASVESPLVNKFNCKFISEDSLRVHSDAERIRAIQVIPGELITREVHVDATSEDGFLVSNPALDVLKLVVLNRYDADALPAVGFVKDFGLKRGALASTVAHDCHNIVAIGTNDRDIAAAINALVEAKGGIAVSNSGNTSVLPLPVAGLMSTEDGYQVAAKYTQMDSQARSLGTNLPAPFMTLSFLALLVIPELKLSDKGLFDGKKFEFVDIAV
jgi:adenine deaminase